MRKFASILVKCSITLSIRTIVGQFGRLKNYRCRGPKNVLESRTDENSAWNHRSFGVRSVCLARQARTTTLRTTIYYIPMVGRGEGDAKHENLTWRNGCVDVLSPQITDYSLYIIYSQRDLVQLYFTKHNV